MRTREIVGALVISLAALVGPVAYGITTDDTPTARCEEDMHCWSPATMGNGVGHVEIGR